MELPNRDKTEDIKVAAPTWPQLNANDCHQILELVGEAGGFVRILAHSDRPLTSAALIETSTTRALIKRHHPVARTPLDLAQEHGATWSLKRAGVPVNTAFKNNRGESAWTVNGWSVEVLTAAKGDDLYRSRHTWQPFLHKSHAFSLGQFLAKMHSVAAQNQIRLDRQLRYQSAALELSRSNKLCHTLQRKAAAIPNHTAFLTKEHIEQIAAAFEPFQQRYVEVASSLGLTLCHADPQANNFFWDNDEPCEAIDFHLALTAPPELDLAVAIDRNCFQWLDILEGDESAIDVEASIELLRGYVESSELKHDQIQALCALLPLHRLDFGFSLMDYFWTIEGSRSKAEWCRDVYLQRHPLFMQSEPAQHAIRNIAASLR